MHTLRPDTHWRRFWAPWVLIVVSLQGKLGGQPLRGELCRQRQQYWWRGFLVQRRVEGKPRELEALLHDGIIVATHSLTDRAITPWPLPAHPRLAATGPPCPP